VDAELWSATVQQAAPRLSAPPAPVPTPAPPPPAPPPPPPPPVVQPQTPAPAPPDIALEREKKLKDQKVQQERELADQQAQKKKELDAKQRADDAAERKKEDQQKLADAEKKKEAADAAKQAEAKKADAAAKQAAADRAATLKRMQGLAGASGGDTATGTALRSSGPSSGYEGRIAAAVRPNITFPDADLVNGNPAAEFEVNVAPDGTIVGVKLSQSSGIPGWDEAAERGLRKTDKLPRDTDGRIFPSLIVSLRPKR